MHNEYVHWTKVCVKYLSLQVAQWPDLIKQENVTHIIESFAHSFAYMNLYIKEKKLPVI